MDAADADDHHADAARHDAVSRRAGPLAVGLLLVSASVVTACSGDDARDLGTDAPSDLGVDATDLGLDAGDDLGADAGLAGCVVTCVAIRPGEYRSECHAAAGATCDVAAYPVCDVDAAPSELRDGGLFLVPACVPPGVSMEVDRIPACAVDVHGAALLTGPPVVTCVTSN